MSEKSVAFCIAICYNYGMVMKQFNIFHFIYIAITVAIIVGAYFLLRRMNEKTRFRVIFGILAFNFALHFLKLLFPPYNNPLPNYGLRSLRFIFPVNICAVSTMIFPFIYISKNNTLKDYMFYIGTISGIAAVIILGEGVDRSPLSFDVIRYFLCHISLVLAPLMMVIFGIHKLDYRRVWRVPLVFLIVLCVICASEVTLTATNLLLDKDCNLETLLSSSVRNNAFIFGPFIGNNGQLENLTWIVDIITPRVFRYNPMTGEPMYWPIVWLIVPAIVYLPLISILMSLPWERKHIARDFRVLRERLGARLYRLKK